MLPHIDTFDESGYTGEERKVAAETRKMLGLPDLRRERDLRARAGDPGALAAVHIETTEADHGRRGPRPADGRARASSSRTSRSSTSTRCRATPPAATTSSWAASARTPPTRAAWPCGWSSDNLRKGAATNAVQIAESLVTRGWL